VQEGQVIQRPAEFSAFEFVVLSGLRAAQLQRGCTPRIGGTQKLITTAQMEIAQRKVISSAALALQAGDGTWQL
jgi:hypothetical protein